MQIENNKYTFVVSSEEELPTVAHTIVNLYPQERIFAFFGEMGAGKTTFIKAFCAYLGVKSPATSPTFTLVNEYQCVSGSIVYHFDFYRIDSLDEACQIGFEDYLHSGAYCFIEWAEKVEPVLQDTYIGIFITTNADNHRIITTSKLYDTQKQF